MESYLAITLSKCILRIQYYFKERDDSEDPIGVAYRIGCTEFHKIIRYRRLK